MSQAPETSSIIPDNKQAYCCHKSIVRTVDVRDEGGRVKPHYVYRSVKKVSNNLS